MRPILRKLAALLGIGAVTLALAGCGDNYPQAQQSGYRGTGMAQFTRPEDEAVKRAANAVPAPEDPVEAGGPPVSELKDVYKNVQVLGDLNEAQFGRIMTSITAWVVPQAERDAGNGCAYCHNVANLAEDSVYTKIVARRMLQMTRHLNANWSAHVGATGVTCYTCHRGMPVPAQVWYEAPGPQALGMTGNTTGKDHPSAAVALSSLPADPFTPLLSKPIADNNLIRVNGTEVLNQGVPGKSIQDTYLTYALMTHFSGSLGVNCTFCHNGDAFSNWENSPPQRVTAWHGIRMARDINGNYISPLAGVFPDNRKGELGDPAKVFCATCHQGVNKPLYGAQMLKDYEIELGGKPALKN